MQHSENFSESDRSADQESSPVASDLNYPSGDYVFFISTYLSAGIIFKTLVDRVVDSGHASSLNTNMISTPI